MIEWKKNSTDLWSPSQESWRLEILDSLAVVTITGKPLGNDQFEWDIWWIDQHLTGFSQKEFAMDVAMKIVEAYLENTLAEIRLLLERK